MGLAFKHSRGGQITPARSRDMFRLVAQSQFPVPGTPQSSACGKQGDGLKGSSQNLHGRHAQWMIPFASVRHQALAA
jgi:hypothetical protein